MLGLKLIHVSKRGPWISAELILPDYSDLSTRWIIIESYAVYVACPGV